MGENPPFSLVRADGRLTGLNPHLKQRVAEYFRTNFYHHQRLFHEREILFKAASCALVDLNECVLVVCTCLTAL